MIRQIEHGNSIYAIVIYADFKDSGIRFFTPGDFPQQLGYMNRPKGYKVEPHKHVLMERKVTQSQEVLVVRSGKVRVDFYNPEGAFLEDLVLSAGDIILLADGGHGFEWLEEGEIVEIKQGPYLYENDKIMLSADTGRKVSI
jgi:hypothetical protein